MIVMAPEEDNVLKMAPLEIMETYSRLTILWKEKYHNDWDGYIYGKEIDRLYHNRDKLQVIESLKFLAKEGYVDIEYSNNEKNDIARIRMYTEELENNVLELIKNYL